MLPGHAEDDPVVLLDGVIIERPVELSDLGVEPDRIARIAIRCWNPETDELPARSGVQLILITTKPAVEAAEARTADAVRKLEAFTHEHGALPATVADLGTGFRSHTLERQKQGWTLTTGDLDGFVCSARALPDTEVQISCVNTYSVDKRALRAAWEQSTSAF